MDAFDVPGQTGPRQARHEAGDGDQREASGDAQPVARRHGSDKVRGRSRYPLNAHGVRSHPGAS